MGIEKPLRDWEMSCLAERVTPMDFDQIALRYLGITKVFQRLPYHCKDQDPPTCKASSSSFHCNSAITCQGMNKVLSSFVHVHYVVGIFLSMFL